MRKFVSVYDAFKQNHLSRQKLDMNEILKGTKSVLANRKKFLSYMKTYINSTEKSCFKSPGISEYPLIRKESLLILPKKTKKYNFYQDVCHKNTILTPSPKRGILFSAKESEYRKRLRENYRSFNSTKNSSKNHFFPNNGLEISKKERYNVLLLDFFHKWKEEHTYNDNKEDEKNNEDFKFIQNEKYSNLKYDENQIFGEDYSKFVSDKIEFLKYKKIENNQTQLESSFKDANGKKIKIKLESVKLIFSPIKKGEEKITLYIPLYYAFLFYYKNFEYFKHILLSTITFSENFEQIFFNDKLISSSIRGISNLTNDKDNYANNTSYGNKIFSYDSKKNVNSCGPKSGLIPKKNVTLFRKMATKNYSNFNNNAKVIPGNNSKINNNSNFNMMRNSIMENIYDKKLGKEEKIYHSKNEKFYNTINNIKNFNEYVFLWETDEKCFLVTIQMPIIYFKHKNIKGEIKAFCDKFLFVYMYKNNFINWDFYALNYLLSMKLFRNIILNNYSILKNNNTHRELINHVIINKSQNKIYNLLSESNEHTTFFYTDKTYTNKLFKLHSYKISFDYAKLNPKIKWKYYLNFIQMKILNQITKYENLNNFFPKIIKTDFQKGICSLDFSIFNDFEAKIFEYEKGKSLAKLKNTNSQGEQLHIDIKYPFIIEEKMMKENNFLVYEENNIELDIKFLQKLNNCPMNIWPKRILNKLYNISRIGKTKTVKGNKFFVYEMMNQQNKSANAKKFMKSTSFNNIPLVSKFHK